MWASYLLAADLAKNEAYVNNSAYVPVTAQLNQNQYDALVGFCYNCGNGSQVIKEAPSVGGNSRY